MDDSEETEPAETDQPPQYQLQSQPTYHSNRCGSFFRDDPHNPNDLWWNSMIEFGATAELA